MTCLGSYKKLVVVRSRIQFPDSRSSALSVAPLVLTHWVFVTLHPAWTFGCLFVPKTSVNPKVSFCLRPSLSLNSSLLSLSGSLLLNFSPRCERFREPWGPPSSLWYSPYMESHSCPHSPSTGCGSNGAMGSGMFVALAFLYSAPRD